MCPHWRSASIFPFLLPITGSLAFRRALRADCTHFLSCSLTSYPTPNNTSPYLYFYRTYVLNIVAICSGLNPVEHQHYEISVLNSRRPFFTLSVDRLFLIPDARIVIPRCTSISLPCICCQSSAIDPTPLLGFRYIHF